MRNNNHMSARNKKGCFSLSFIMFSVFLFLSSLIPVQVNAQVDDAVGSVGGGFNPDDFDFGNDSGGGLSFGNLSLESLDLGSFGLNIGNGYGFLCKRPRATEKFECPRS